MRSTLRRLRGRHGTVPTHVTVHTRHPWYWRSLVACLLLAAGYLLGYWQVPRGGLMNLTAGNGAPSLQKDLLSRLVLVERQLQIERATRSNTVKEMGVLQDEIMQLKEDVAFYKGILAERGASGTPKFQDMKLIKGSHPGEYHYQTGLTQVGRQDRPVRGSLRLVLQGMQEGKSVAHNLDVEGRQKSIMVNFKKYRLVEGSFSIPAAMQAQSLLVEFTELGKERPTLSQAIGLSE